MRKIKAIWRLIFAKDYCVITSNEKATITAYDMDARELIKEAEYIYYKMKDIIEDGYAQYSAIKEAQAIINDLNQTK